MKNKLLLIFIVFLLNISIINAVNNNAVASYETPEDAENTVKILFHSWGEGLVTTIDLDDYFPTKRDQNSQYLYVSPPEIIVSIDQSTGIATLKESKDWIGTKEVFFSLASIYRLYEGQTNLQKYVEKIKKERESETIKNNINEFEDSSLYPYLNSLLDKLEKEKGSSETPEIKATFQKPDLKIDVGDTINFNIGVQTKTAEGVKTYRPYLILNIKPEKISPTLEEGAGYSIWILAPLFIIILVLAVMLYFYLKDHISSIKRFINKIIPTKKKTKVDVLSQDIKNLKSFSLDLKNLSNQIGKLQENTLSEKYFNTTKKVFNSLTHPSYEFTYAEITKEIVREDLEDIVKTRLVEFSKELSDLRYSGERITKPEVKQLIQKTLYFIDKAIETKQKSSVKESIKLVQKAPWIKYLNFITSFFKKEEEEIKKLEKKIEIKKPKEKISLTKNILHALGLYKTEEEKKKTLQVKKELEQKRLDKLKRKKELKLKTKRERRENIRKFFRDKLGLFKTPEEKRKELQVKKELEIKKIKEKEAAEKVKKLELRRLEEQKRIKKLEERDRLKRNIRGKIDSFFRFIIKKRKLTPAEELQILMRLERQALASYDTQKAYEIDKKISQLYKEIQKKPSLIDKEIHEAYKKLKDEIKSIEQKISQSRPRLELHKPKIGFLDNFRKAFSQQLEKPKLDEIRFLVKKIEQQFELKSPDYQKISEFFLRANALYKTLNNISKNNITQELLRIKNKIGVMAVKSAIQRAETALRENQLKKAEEIYNNLNKTYYDLPLKEREKLHEKRMIIQQKLKPIIIAPVKEEKIKKPFFKFHLFKPKFKKPLLKPSLQKDIEKIKEKVIEKFEKKIPEKKAFEIKQSFKDYLTAKRPNFPAIQTFLTKKETENKQASEILNVIKDIYNYLSKKQYEKAKNAYLEAIKLFKELPDDIPSEIRDNIYHKLIPLKKQILDSSLQGSLQKAKEAVMTGKIKDAKEHHQVASKIYTHLASNTDVFIPGPITLKEKELDNLIQKANDLIKSNRIKEVKEIYTRINEIYNELPPFKKQSYYNKVSVIYNELIKK